MKKKILFLSPLPPPIYGSNLSSLTCLKVIQQHPNFEVKNIQLNHPAKFIDLNKITLGKLFGGLILIGKTLAAVNRFKPDLIYIMPSTGGFSFIRDFGAALTFKLLNQRVIYHLRTQLCDGDLNNGVKSFILKNAFKDSAAIVLGKELMEGVNKYIPAEQIKILPNAIRKTLSDGEFQSIQKERLKTPKLRLLFLSNMIKEKGWPQAIETARILKDRDCDFDMTFAGSWPSRAEEIEFQTLVEEYGLQEFVRHIGFIKGKKKQTTLAQSDLLIFPTAYRYEALPRVIIEAMEYGLPVIANSTAAIPSTIVDAYTGFLLVENTPQEIVEKIDLMHSKQKIAEMGRNARQRYADHYELEILRKSFISILNDQLHGQPNGSAVNGSQAVRTNNT
ncbi:glycosyltransferase family 4 protein [Mangrovibacterium sp.]|uniref:glycosyltransferase family 4 protein n=1 Tax=Mangrovibacterium sp. TaxID=1961364 RepID=UPI0035684542